jgi:hypothetical protein
MEVAGTLVLKQLKHGFGFGETDAENGRTLSKQSGWPRGPMARRLTTIETIGIKRLQVRSLPWSLLFKFFNLRGCECRIGAPIVSFFFFFSKRIPNSCFCAEICAMVKDQTRRQLASSLLLFSFCPLHFIVPHHGADVGDVGTRSPNRSHLYR